LRIVDLFKNKCLRFKNIKKENIYRKNTYKLKSYVKYIASKGSSNKAEHQLQKNQSGGL